MAGEGCLVLCPLLPWQQPEAGALGRQGLEPSFPPGSPAALRRGCLNVRLQAVPTFTPVWASVAGGPCPCALPAVDLHEKCQGFLRGLVFFHGGGGTLPPCLTFSRQSRCNLFLLERKYRSPGRPQAIFFEGCVGRGCGRVTKGTLWGRARPQPRQGGVTARSFPPQLRGQTRRNGAVLSASRCLHPQRSHWPRQGQPCSHFLTLSA